jgi:hypothetical protein
MKSYTDLEQSKKLAKILPLESADMAYWKKSYLPSNYAVAAYQIEKLQKGFEPEDIEYIPCWSLAALFSVIPQEIFGGEYIINITEGIDNRWVLTYDYFENRNHSYYSLSIGADNLVDACYKMIIKLHEQKLL